jgi:uncharacterized surface protein with fasciclin (FAS1) repeats
MIGRRAFSKAALAAAIVPLSGCAGGAGPGGASGTVLGTARAEGLSRFLAAVDRAGLAETLAGEGPYTLFAPSNRAFAAARLPDDAEALQRLIAYHVVPGTFTIAFLDGADVNYTTLEGSSLNVDGTGAVVRAGGAAIVQPDLAAANGVVHVVDAVLHPS